MPNPFAEAGRAQALRALIGSILGGKQSDVARQDMLDEIERRLAQEQWQRGMSERGLGLQSRRLTGEEAGREATAEFRKATLAESVLGREQAGRLATEAQTSQTGREMLSQLGSTARSFVGPLISQFGTGIREAIARRAETADRPTWEPFAGLGQEYGMDVTPETRLDPGALQLLATMMREKGETARGREARPDKPMGEADRRREIRNLYADRDGGEKQVFDTYSGAWQTTRVEGVPPSSRAYKDLTWRIEQLLAALPEGMPPAPPPGPGSRPPLINVRGITGRGPSAMGFGGGPRYPGVVSPEVDRFTIDDLAAMYGG